MCNEQNSEAVNTQTSDNCVVHTLIRQKNKSGDVKSISTKFLLGPLGVLNDSISLMLFLLAALNHAIQGVESKLTEGHYDYAKSAAHRQHKVGIKEKQEKMAGGIMGLVASGVTVFGFAYGAMAKNIAPNSKASWWTPRKWGTQFFTPREELSHSLKKETSESRIKADKVSQIKNRVDGMAMDYKLSQNDDHDLAVLTFEEHKELHAIKNNAPYENIYAYKNGKDNQIRQDMLVTIDPSGPEKKLSERANKSWNRCLDGKRFDDHVEQEHCGCNGGDKHQAKKIDHLVQRFRYDYGLHAEKDLILAGDPSRSLQVVLKNSKLQNLPSDVRARGRKCNQDQVNGTIQVVDESGCIIDEINGSNINSQNYTHFDLRDEVIINKFRDNDRNLLESTMHIAEQRDMEATKHLDSLSSASDSVSQKQNMIGQVGQSISQFLQQYTSSKYVEQKNEEQGLVSVSASVDQGYGTGEQMASQQKMKTDDKINGFEQMFQYVAKQIMGANGA